MESDRAVGVSGISQKEGPGTVQASRWVLRMKDHRLAFLITGLFLRNRGARSRSGENGRSTTESWKWAC
jgi:hypothetical protein